MTGQQVGPGPVIGGGGLGNQEAGQTIKGGVDQVAGPKGAGGGPHQG